MQLGNEAFVVVVCGRALRPFKPVNGLFVKKYDNQSDAIDRWVEEDSAREVRIAPLSERSLPLEIPFVRRVVRSLQRFMEGLIGCNEMASLDWII